MKIAIYKTAEYGFDSVHEVSDWIEDDGDYIRLSEIMEIDFVMLDKSETVKSEVDAIDKLSVRNHLFDHGSPEGDTLRQFFQV